MANRILFIFSALLIVTVSPSHAFLDYFFSGSASRDAIDNSAVGDLRAWWSGNPVYTFNPYYSGPASTGQQQQQPQQEQQQAMQPQASVNFYPGGQPGAYQQAPQQPGAYGYQGYAPGAYQQQAPPQPMYGAAQQQYQQPMQYPTQPQAQPVYQVPQQQQYAPMGQAPQGYPAQQGGYQ